jgi:hypothetical protein
MSAKGIPFSQEDRATIRSTSMWMMIAGAIMSVCGAYLYYHLYEPLLLFGFDAVFPLAMPLLVTNGLLGLGLMLVIGSRKFARVAAEGSVTALSSGLSVLTIIYVVQAVLLLAGLAGFALLFLLPFFG